MSSMLRSRSRISLAQICIDAIGSMLWRWPASQADSRTSKPYHGSLRTGRQVVKIALCLIGVGTSLLGLHSRLPGIRCPEYYRTLCWSYNELANLSCTRTISFWSLDSLDQDERLASGVILRLCQAWVSPTDPAEANHAKAAYLNYPIKASESLSSASWSNRLTTVRVMAL